MATNAISAVGSNFFNWLAHKLLSLCLLKKPDLCCFHVNYETTMKYNKCSKVKSKL